MLDHVDKSFRPYRVNIINSIHHLSKSLLTCIAL